MNITQLAGMLVFLGFSGSLMAEPQLYETGPSEESSYVRFVNATGNAIEISSSKGSAKVALNTAANERVSHFFTVKAGVQLTASIQGNGRKVQVAVQGKPWEYITVAILPLDTKQFKTATVKETPEDFNAMRSSVALFNLDATCMKAAMHGGAKDASIFEDVRPFTLQRRLINPVKLNATVGCEGSSIAVDMSQLQAGGRYSVFLVAEKNVRKAFFVLDSN